LSLATRVLDHLAEVPAPEWDALAAHEPARASPFVRHAFLSALERSGCVAPRRGWRPRHLAIHRGHELVAAAPAYLTDGEGDFSRDWSWSAAAERAGLRWTPKLVLGVPFTPATGRRLLVREGEDRAALSRALARAALDLARREGAATVQVLFPQEDEAALLAESGFAERVDFQYHWVNAGYATMDDFLARFPSKRRNQIRRERAAPAAQGIAIRTVRGEELARDPAGWARACFDLHRASTDRMDWGMRYVNRAFYEAAVEGMPDAIEVVEARRPGPGGRLVAMAFNVAGEERLYGRYWGCVEDHPFLHFNVCLYHSIEECIRRGTRVFEGGAGGEHKLARGFEPAFTHSAHRSLDPRLDRAIRDYLAQERDAREEALRRFGEASPIFKRASGGSP
jgi:predicted N-acyltransferase